MQNSASLRALRNKAFSFSDALASHTDCAVCDDTGVIAVEHRAYRINESWIAVPLTHKKACLCDAGAQALLEWHVMTCAHCDFGFVAQDANSLDKSALRDYNVLTTLSDYACLQCEEGRRIAREVEDFLAARVQKQFEKLLATSELLESLKGKTFENFVAYSDTLALARDVVYSHAQQLDNVLLVGTFGIGKSHLCAAYLNYWLVRGKTGVFTTIPDLMGKLRATIGSNDENWDALLQKYIECDVLVLDDLGQGKVTAKLVETLFTILNARIQNKKTTIVSSNYSLEELRTKLNNSHEIDAMQSGAIISRLSSFECVSWQASDYRSMHD